MSPVELSPIKKQPAADGREIGHVQMLSEPASLEPVVSGQARGAGLFKKIVTVAVVAAFAILGWAYLTGHLGQDHREVLPPEDAAALERPPGTMVTAEPITIRSLHRTVEVVGTLYGFEEIVVSAKIEGRVLGVQHDVSDRIAAGELLVTIDPTDLKLAVAQAESNLQVELAKLGLSNASDSQFEIDKVPTVVLAKEKQDLAHLKMERIQSLAQRQATTQEGVDNAVSEFRMAGAEYENQVLIAKSSLASIKARQAALAIAQQQLADTSVKAPVPQRIAPTGDQAKPYVMTKRLVAEGTFMRVGDEICRLVIDGTLKLRVAVPERYSAQLALGQNVRIFTQSSDTPFDGTLTMINPAVETKTRTFQVEIQVANNRPGLKPGGFAKAVIDVSEDPEARTVPLAAMVRYAGVIKLFLIENGQAREVQFTPGMQTSEWVEVVTPKLPADAVVVTSGQFSLSEGARVSIREPQNKTPTEPAAETLNTQH